MADVPATDTFRLYGMINNTRITILVDSESTHNFVQPRVAKFLNLRMHDTRVVDHAVKTEGIRSRYVGHGVKANLWL